VTAPTQLVVPDRDGEVWHGFVPGVGAGQVYGFRVNGPFDPALDLFKLPDEHNELRTVLRDICEKEIAPYAADVDELRDSRKRL
jgi:pullulanase/glycogen debranching enzyme